MLARHVCLTDPGGSLVQFGPGDEVPAWARRMITNPRVWVDDAHGPPRVSGAKPEPAADPVVRRPRPRRRKTAEGDPDAAGVDD